MTTKSLIAKGELSATEILNSLQSLLIRSLIEKQTLAEGIVFTVMPIIREYFRVIKKGGN